MAKNEQQVTDEQQQYNDYINERNADFTRTVIGALFDRDDVVSVISPGMLKMKSAKGALLITGVDGTVLRARFYVEEAVTLE